MSVNKFIPRANSPKEVGVSSKVIKEFLSDAIEKGYEYHSLMVIRHGKVAVEWYNEPYNKDTPQAVYSVSKSFTSTAIGFAINEGLISLDTKLVDIFLILWYYGHAGLRQTPDTHDKRGYPHGRIVFR